MASTSSNGAAITPLPRPRLPPSSRSRCRPPSKRYISNKSRRCFSSASSSGAEQQSREPSKDVAAQIRALMRQSAQPVAIITAFLPPASASKSKGSASEGSSTIVGEEEEADRGEALLVHGATLSSLTTVSLDPPRVAFSLKLPSRMADALLHHQRHSQRIRAAKYPSSHLSPRPHFIINLLSSTQARIAASLARPGTAPLDPATHPTLLWSSASKAAAAAAAVTQGELGSAEQVMGGDAHPLHMEDLVMSAHAFSSRSSTAGGSVGTDKGQREVEEEGEGEGVPLLRDSLGALACTLETSLDLGSEVITMDSSAHDRGEGEGQGKVDEAEEAGSRLFIARVDAVEGVQQANCSTGAGGGVESDEESKLPLLYWRLGFTTVKQES
ncbi:hypothetical protein BCV69DRAFT_300804 [Microstroma glucosiphilum]|uniref:Flavin reductase like domain-containing protein n=1 Tax=Pseudomicrostroma glucosiphilum TaxID=1684307 RepID=A0A316U3H0_9BASI|nr:hypothetical protein BCV69DRAFT_300804 [Pseudomicrostroma glucosiphilum]PWN19021.1 hypothetical protein BCV69DRAFT_300804 [Pseudomicrostroma glucosiphilum]